MYDLKFIQYVHCTRSASYDLCYINFNLKILNKILKPYQNNIVSKFCNKKCYYIKISMFESSVYHDNAKVNDKQSGVKHKSIVNVTQTKQFQFEILAVNGHFLQGNLATLQGFVLKRF